MKQFVRVWAVAAIAIAVFINICQAQNNSRPANADAPLLTSQGIKPVVIGAVVKDLPDAVPGLYASKAFVMPQEEQEGEAIDPETEGNFEENMEEDGGFYDMYGWIFYDDQGEVLFSAQEDENGRISQITIISDGIMTKEGVHVGMAKADVEKVKGIKRIEANPYADFSRDGYMLNGVSLWMDWDGQDIVAEMTVEPDEFDIIYKKAQKTHQTIISFINKADKVQNINAYIDDIKRLDNVKNAYINEDKTLFVEVEGFGYLTYSSYPKPSEISRQSVNEMMNALHHLMAIAPEQIKYDDLVLVNQMENDPNFKGKKEVLELMENLFKTSGFKNVSKVSPTLDFFKREMFNHNLVFLNTHGCYDDTLKIHWLLTSEVATESAVKQYANFFINGMYGGAALLTLNSQIHEDGVDNTQYFMVSENFIRMAENHFNEDLPAVVFNTACQSLKNGDALGEAFRDKGAELYLGFTDTNNVGTFGGSQYFTRLLSGMSIDAAYKSIDEIFKKSTCTDKGKTYQPELKPVHNRFIEKGKKYFAIKPSLKKDFFIYGDKDLSIKIEGKAPLCYLEWVKEKDGKWYPYYNRDLDKIPLLYGFEFCKNKDFKEGDVMRFFIKINENETNKVLEDGTIIYAQSCERQDMAVNFKVALTAPYSVKFYDPNLENVYVRSFIYDKETNVYNYGDRWCFPKSGGKSDQ